MSEGLTLRDLVMERLVVAADEIFALFERTIAEYEEALLRTKPETHNKCVQTLNLEEVDSSPEQTLSIKQEAEPSLGFPLTSVSVKAENNVVCKSFLLQQEPPEESREEPGCSLYLQSDKDKQTYSCSDTDDSDDWEPSAKRTTTCDRQESETVQRKDSKRGEIKCGLLQSSPQRRHQAQIVEQDWDPESSQEWMETAANEHNFKNSLMRFNTIQSEVQLHKHIFTQNEQMPYSCPVCKKGFTKSNYLKRHMTTHSTVKSSTCPECGLKLKHPRNLYRHISAVHRGDRPYSCSICEKAFAQKSCFITHMRTHTGEKPFSCAVCDKSFVVKGALINHMKRVHRTVVDLM